LGENIIVLLGVVALGWARAENIGQDVVERWQSALSGGGLSLGHWLAVARDVSNASRLSNLELGGMADAVRPRKAGTGLLGALDDVVRVRNLQAHGGPPRGQVETAERLSILEPSIAQALEGSDFLASAELLQIEDCALQRGNDGFEIAALRLRGDHPDYERIRFLASDPLVDQTLVLRSGETMIDLTPFGLVRDCPKCGGREVYYPDRIEKDTTVFRSFDSRHELKDASWTSELIDIRSSSPKVAVQGTKHDDRPSLAPAAASTIRRGLPDVPPPPPPPSAGWPPPPLPPTAPRTRAAEFVATQARSGWDNRQQIMNGVASRTNSVLGRRVVARIIDWGVAFALLIAVMIPIGVVDGLFASHPPGQPNKLSGTASGLMFVVWIGACFAYEVIGTTKYGATLGKGARKLRVSRRDGAPLTTSTALVRAISGTAMLVIPPLNIIDVLWARWDDDGDTLHDKVSKTHVDHLGHVITQRF
jgi:uncharacterized RDD family membrane protein YckC